MFRVQYDPSTERKIRYPTNKNFDYLIPGRERSLGEKVSSDDPFVEKAPMNIPRILTVRFPKSLSVKIRW